MDDTELFERKRRRTRRIGVAVAALIFAAPIGYTAWKWYGVTARNEERVAARKAALALSDDQLERVAALIPERRAALQSQRVAWAAAMTPEALAAVVPGEGACRVRFKAPTVAAAKSYIEHGSIDVNYFGPWGLKKYPGGTAIPDADLAGMVESLAKIEARLEAGEADANDLKDLERPPATTLFVVVDRETEPVVISDALGAGGYDAGRVEGRVFVYAFDAGKIICAGPIDAINSAEVEFNFSYSGPMDRAPSERAAAMSVLQRDLDVNLRKAIASGLRAAAG